MTEHPTRDEIELFVVGAEDGIEFTDIADHLRSCDACAGALTTEARLEGQLVEVAGRARYCPGCQTIVTEDRCHHCGVALRPGGFEVERVLVSSGHGRLYLATGAGGERVALKELVFTQIPSTQTLVAFEREAKLLQQLDHPGVPRFVSSFTEGEGVHTRFYLAQEYVEGASLLARMSTHRFTEEDIVRIARQVLDILEYLHGLEPRVVHRDVKPANILMRKDGSIVLVDFGAARDFSLTGGATLVGTFGYMPPEQLVGMADATSDLYALGASIAHLLTRRPPWQLSLGSRALDGLGVSVRLRGFVSRLTAVDPGDRFPSAREARLALLRPRSRFEERRPWIAAAAAAIALAGLVMGIAARTDRSERGVPAAPRVVPSAPRVVPAAPVQPSQPPMIPIQGSEDSDRIFGEAQVVRRRAHVTPPDDENKAKGFAAKGKKFLIVGKVAAAEEALTRCVALDPDHADCHRLLGVLYAQKDETSRSIRHYKRYVELRPDAPDAARVNRMVRDAEQQP
jgi:hypothetical protein